MNDTWDGDKSRLLSVDLAGYDLALVDGGLVGPIKVKGQDWNLNMLAAGAIYTDEQLADVLSYIRNAWGNKASIVTPEQVKKVRTELGGRTQPYTADELLKLEE